MKEGVTDPGTHERYFDVISFHHKAAYHRRQYIAVQKRTQNTSTGRRVPFEFAILRDMR